MVLLLGRRFRGGVMLVFWCLLLVGGVNVVVMSSYEMPSYYADLV